MKKLIPILATLLAVAAVATGHYLHKKHLRLGHAPLLKAAHPSSHLKERAVNIHDAPLPSRTKKDLASEAKLEPTVAACQEPPAVARQETFAWTSSNNDAMEDVLNRQQAKAFHARAGCQAFN
jgi:hypothetical protein